MKKFLSRKFLGFILLEATVTTLFVLNYITQDTWKGVFITLFFIYAGGNVIQKYSKGVKIEKNI